MKKGLFLLMRTYCCDNCLQIEKIVQHTNLLNFPVEKVLVNAGISVDMKFIQSLLRIKFCINKNKGISYVTYSTCTFERAILVWCVI